LVVHVNALDEAGEAQTAYRQALALSELVRRNTDAARLLKCLLAGLPAPQPITDRDKGTRDPQG
jgi:hypothetical protein